MYVTDRAKWLKRRCAFFIVSFPIHQLNGEGPMGLEEGRATRWKEPESLNNQL